MGMPMKKFKEFILEKITPGSAGMSAAKLDQVFDDNDITFEPDGKDHFKVLKDGVVKGKKLSSSEARSLAKKLCGLDI